MKDLISRQAAIEAIKEDKIDLTNPNVVAVFKATGDFEKVGTQVMTCDRHIKILKELPSECKHGKWVEANTHTYGIYECTACKAWTYIPNEPRDYNFCPRCGSDMREVDDGQV